MRLNFLAYSFPFPVTISRCNQRSSVSVVDSINFLLPRASPRENEPRRRMALDDNKIGLSTKHVGVAEDTVHGAGRNESTKNHLQATSVHGPDFDVVNESSQQEQHQYQQHQYQQLQQKQRRTKSRRKKDVFPGRKRKSYESTVCMVPAASDRIVWEALTKARTELRDPGLYRWPPHANILYPFAEFKRISDKSLAASSHEFEGGHSTDQLMPLFKDDEILDSTHERVTNGILSNTHEAWGTLPEGDIVSNRRRGLILELLLGAAQKCEPFQVTLDRLGCFGGQTRGVLWIYPRSYYPSEPATRNDDTSASANETASSGFQNPEPNMKDETLVAGDQEEPLIYLQRCLQQALPDFFEQEKNGGYKPHITLSHFETLADAEEAQRRVEEWWEPRTFTIQEIYVLRRVGDDGQFKVAAIVPLGRGSRGVQVFHPPRRFPDMPTSEEDWVREERMKLKSRRSKKRPSRGWVARRRSSRGESGRSCCDTRGKSQSKDTAK